ncbi:RNA polymerase sigma factor SigX [Sporosarcina cyprini]|uniref:RNA polymerase sigma factor SigX n=1 Tax=Sporosarcina cyprini TaxID=2910523 RepID=UPI001EDF9C80|nr:RNA polymerase sigma factor SigX [Sporosarcina cyprini]
MDDSVFHRLYDQYHQDVFNFLIYLTGDRSQSEDLMHEVYIRVLKAYAGFEGKSSEKTWLFSIAKNVAIDHFRKKTVRQKHVFDTFDWEKSELMSSDRSPVEIAELNEEMKQMLKALDTCTGDQKMVIVMRYFQDFSIAETAEALGWTEGKVKTTQHRAIKTLQKKLQALSAEGGR